MNRKFMLSEPEQLDFWPDNVIEADFRLGISYELSPPLSNSRRIIEEWFVASGKAKAMRERRYREWAEYLYSIRCMVSQLRLKVYKQGNTIIVERIPYRGEALRRKMAQHNLQVVK